MWVVRYALRSSNQALYRAQAGTSVLIFLKRFTSGLQLGA